MDKNVIEAISCAQALAASGDSEGACALYTDLYETVVHAEDHYHACYSTLHGTCPT